MSRKAVPLENSPRKKEPLLDRIERSPLRAELAEMEELLQDQTDYLQATFLIQKKEVEISELRKKIADLEKKHPGIQALKIKPKRKKSGKKEEVKGSETVSSPVMPSPVYDQPSEAEMSPAPSAPVKRTIPFDQRKSPPSMSNPPFSPTPGVLGANDKV